MSGVCSRLFLLLILLLASAAGPAGAQPPAVPLYREFGRWLVACDNTRSCVARGFDETTRAELNLTRGAGDAPATLAFAADQTIDPDMLRMDGRPIPLAKPAWSMQDGAPSTSDPMAVAAFIVRAREGHLVTLDPDVATNDAPRAVPLDGFTAAVLLMDAVQRRPGTASALIADKGDGVAPAAPPVPRAPRWRRPPALTRAESARLSRQAARLASPAFGACTVDRPAEIHPLDDASALAIRPCYMAAYQGSSVVAVLPRAGGTAKPVSLILPGVPDAASDGPDMVDPDFNPATGILSSVSKGRGLADCGSAETWIWSDGAFRLLALGYQGMCGGAAPGNWPVLYRTR